MADQIVEDMRDLCRFWQEKLNAAVQNAGDTVPMVLEAMLLVAATNKMSLVGPSEIGRMLREMADEYERATPIVPSSHPRH